MAGPREVAVAELASRLGQPGGPVVLDVREAEELASGTLPGAVHLPLGRLAGEVERVLPDRARPVVTCCAVGVRSRTAAALLDARGYREVASLAGGWEAWVRAGGDVQGGGGLTAGQRARYARHLSLPELGVEGQQRLLKGSVLVVGAGGLGCPVVQYLAAAGVGTLGVVDDDVVDSSNLQRQVLHTEAAQGTPKVDSAARAVGALNSGVTVRTHRVRLKAANALKVMAPYDVVVDACDNFPTRYLLNDAAVMLGKPLVHGSIWRFSGQVTVFKPGEGPCYRCLHPVPPPPGMVPSCQDAGVLGVLPGIIGTLQALEAMKLLAGFGRPLVGRLLQFEGLPAEAREIRIRREKQCPACGDAPTIRELVDGEAFCQQGSP